MKDDLYYPETPDSKFDWDTEFASYVADAWKGEDDDWVTVRPEQSQATLEAIRAIVAIGVDDTSAIAAIRRAIDTLIKDNARWHTDIVESKS